MKSPRIPGQLIRCLKRYVAREVFAVLQEMRQTNPTNAT